MEIILRYALVIQQSRSLVLALEEYFHKAGGQLNTKFAFSVTPSASYATLEKFVAAKHW